MEKVFAVLTSKPLHENVVYSPHAITRAMALLALGSEGQAKREIAEFLGYSGDPRLLAEWLAHAEARLRVRTPAFTDLEREMKLFDPNVSDFSLAGMQLPPWAYLVTRGNVPFQKHNLSASPRTIQRWATRFRQGLSRRSERKTSRGRPPTADKIVEFVLTLKRENMQWGQKKISQALRRMGVQVSAPTVQKILEENGLGPLGGGRTWEAYTSAAKDALWALVDFFVVRTLRGELLQVMAVIDVYTRELLTLRAYDGWDVDSAWTMRTLAAAISELKRRPTAVMHDRASQFAGQVERQLRVLEVDQCRLPPRLPALNGILERTIKSLRWELLDHIRVATVEQLQWYLDEYRAYWGSDRCHQGIEGRAPVDRADNVPVADVLDLNELRRRRLVRKSSAHGLLNSYSLERVDQAAQSSALSRPWRWGLSA